MKTFKLKLEEEDLFEIFLRNEEQMMNLASLVEKALKDVSC